MFLLCNYSGYTNRLSQDGLFSSATTTTTSLILPYPLPYPIIKMLSTKHMFSKLALSSAAFVGVRSVQLQATWSESCLTSGDGRKQIMNQEKQKS